MATDTVRYDAALVNGREYVIGQVMDRRNKLTLSQYRELVSSHKGPGNWITVGWSNPLAPNDWKDE